MKSFLQFQNGIETFAIKPLRVTFLRKLLATPTNCPQLIERERAGCSQLLQSITLTGDVNHI
jgi:hypothetical protein